MIRMLLTSAAGSRSFDVQCDHADPAFIGMVGAMNTALRKMEQVGDGDIQVVTDSFPGMLEAHRSPDDHRGVVSMAEASRLIHEWVEPETTR